MKLKPDTSYTALMREKEERVSLNLQILWFMEKNQVQQRTLNVSIY